MPRRGGEGRPLHGLLPRADHLRGRAGDELLVRAQEDEAALGPMLLSPLMQADIPEVMRLERLPGYDAFIGRWEADEHAAEMASPDARYFGVRQGRRLAAFLILQ